jgi:hypothetical protein
MKHWKSIVLISLVLLLISSACTPTTTPEAVTHGTSALGDQALLKTKVAATLTALAPVLPPRGEAPTQSAPEATRAADPTAVAAAPTAASPAAVTVYAKDGVVYLWTDGASHPLTSPGSAVYTVLLSDDGSRVAYTRQVDDLRQEIWAVSTDGVDGTLLMSSADFAAIDPEALAVLPNQIGWVPGSHILAFNTHQVFEGPGISPYDDLHLIDVDTFERRTPFLAGEGGDFYFSPDGAQVAFSTPTRVDLANLDGSNRRPAALSFEMVLTFSEYMLYPPLVWAADSSSLWAAIPPHDAMAIPAQPTSVWNIPADGSPAVRTAEFNVAPLLGFELPISPDTQRMAYLAEIGAAPDTQLELHLRTLDGSVDETIHTTQFMDFLSWSPDGRQYAVNVGNELTLYIGTVGGSFAPAPGAPVGVSSLDWLDPEQYVYLQTGASGSSLAAGSLSAAPQVIDTVAEGFIAYSVP